MLNWRRWFKLLCSVQCRDLATVPRCLKLLRCWRRWGCREIGGHKEYWGTKPRLVIRIRVDWYKLLWRLVQFIRATSLWTIRRVCAGVCVCMCECECAHACACVCVHMCMCYVLCVLWTLCLIYSILDFQIGKTEEALGCFRFSVEKHAWHVYNVCPRVWLFWKDLFTARHTCWTKVSDIKKRIGIYT
jgi:hypothetical protein